MPFIFLFMASYSMALTPLPTLYVLRLDVDDRVHRRELVGMVFLVRAAMRRNVREELELVLASFELLTKICISPRLRNAATLAATTGS